MSTKASKNCLGEFFSNFIFPIHKHRKVIEVAEQRLSKFKQTGQYLRVCTELFCELSQGVKPHLLVRHGT